MFSPIITFLLFNMCLTQYVRSPSNVVYCSSCSLFVKIVRRARHFVIYGPPLMIIFGDNAPELDLRTRHILYHYLLSYSYLWYSMRHVKQPYFPSLTAHLTIISFVIFVALASAIQHRTRMPHTNSHTEALFFYSLFTDTLRKRSLNLFYIADCLYQRLRAFGERAATTR
jgi:hypothetical protein